MINFLIQYNRRSGAMTLREFTGPNGGATAIRERLRLEVTAGPDDEIVVIAANSRAALERNHSRYFKSASQMVSDWLTPTGT